MKTKNKHLIPLEEFKEKHYGKRGTKKEMHWKQAMKISRSVHLSMMPDYLKV
jgi:hypothetical protein